MSDDFLGGLNPAQLQAVVHDNGPLLIVAGPGSGKTRVITGRIAYRIRRGTAGNSLVAITFTNRAAREMHNRLSALAGHDIGVHVGTFHWMCGSILRRRADRIGIPRDFVLAGRSEARVALVGALNDLGTPMRVPQAAEAIGWWKNGASLEAAARRFGLNVDAFGAIRDRYDARLRAVRALDLDDLQRLTVELLREDLEVRNEYRRRFDEILVDEFQDTNPVQQELLQLMLPESRRLTVVGDEDQAIYGWRLASAGGMRRFSHHFPDARVVTLEEAYRSTKHILRAANALIAHNRDRIPKNMRTSNPAGRVATCLIADDEREEAEEVAVEIERLHRYHDYSWSDIAVLFRVNFLARSLEDALVRHGIPYYVVSGQPFYRRPEVRKVVTYLRLVLDTRDEEATAALLADVPGMGPRRIELLRTVSREAGKPALDMLDTVSALPRPVRQRLTELKAAIRSLVGQRDAPLMTQVDSVVRTVSEEVETSSVPDRETTLDNLAELRSVAREFAISRGTLRTFIDRLLLGADDESGRDGVHLMTIHAAKGLEFPVVFMTGLEEGMLPHRRSLDTEDDTEEERRLCYVGITRAKEMLHLSYTHTRLLGGHAVTGSRSRFISEMGPSNLAFRSGSRVQLRPRLASVRVGDHVRHPRWQDGIVRVVEGRGRDTMITIDFGIAGRQRLQLCHAPLSLISGSTT